MKEPILIVSDDPQEREAVAATLEPCQQKTLTAGSSMDGLRQFRKHRPIRTMVNINMPGGRELIESLFSERPDIQMMILSDGAGLESALHLFKDRAAEYIQRPVHPDALIFALNRVDRFIGLQDRLRKFNDDLEALAEQKAQQAVETERFLAVRQIVDRMSAFIAQVAGDVHGGVKYFNELPYFVSIHSPDCRILAANPTYIHHLGYRIHGNSWEIYSGKRATKENCPVGRTLRSEDVMETRALLRYKSGAKVPVAVHTAPIFNDDGEIALILEIFAGSKEIEVLAQEVRSTQQRYQQLFDAVPNHVAVLDRRMRLTAVNRKFKEDFGSPLGRNFFEFLRPGRFPAFRDPITQTIKDGTTHQGEMVLTAVDGKKYNMTAATTPIKTPAGKLIQVLVIFADITQLRQLQDNLSSLGLMIGTISHDLKGNLTGLDAGVYLIDSGFYRNRPGRIEEGLDVVKLMAERMRKQVQDILLFAKERELQTREVDVEQFSADVAANMDERIRSANIVFECEFASDTGKFWVDPGLLRATLINILENAMEACIEDETTEAHRIRFTTRRSGDQIEFVIRDNGTGMSRDQLKNMFTLFFTTKGSKGTGLGLFIANKTVKKHGGTISVDSKTGEGTTFQIRIPCQLPAGID